MWMWIVVLILWLICSAIFCVMFFMGAHIDDDESLEREHQLKAIHEWKKKHAR